MEISKTRMMLAGTDALSPAPHHNVYSIEGLKQLVHALKEASDYTKLVAVKIAAVHNLATIASGIVRTNAYIIMINGMRRDMKLINGLVEEFSKYFNTDLKEIIKEVEFTKITPVSYRPYGKLYIH